MSDHSAVFQESSFWKNLFLWAFSDSMNCVIMFLLYLAEKKESCWGRKGNGLKTCCECSKNPHVTFRRRYFIDDTTHFICGGLTIVKYLRGLKTLFIIFFPDFLVFCSPEMSPRFRCRVSFPVSRGEVSFLLWLLSLFKDKEGVSSQEFVTLMLSSFELSSQRLFTAFLWLMKEFPPTQMSIKPTPKRDSNLSRKTPPARARDLSFL